ncbi:PREDICTED: golgin candidate 2 isoform X2 [Tarenaya hassleriana]|uniref:golgin candidate 2 isoform X2 n=1 Tax=Tarenaya hassleriana TaxID=28532 RepID=UPI00053C46D3|nr:PREDICTED: golgin candidate 2 isoform X2 [Tarenaya hassleriana]
MANWISSKLKAAETILQQIDQQAAESLRKNEKSQTHDEVFETPTKSGSPISLKDQLKKKTHEGSDYDGGSQRSSFEQSPSSLSNSKAFFKPDQPKERTGQTSQSLTQQKPTLTDSDWTKLLSTPNPGTSTSKARTTNGTSMARGLKKDGKRHGNSGSNLLTSGGKKSERSTDDAIESRGRLLRKPNEKPKDGENSSSSGFGMQTDSKTFDGGHVEHADATQDISIKPKHKESENDVNSEPPPPKDSRRSLDKTLQEAMPNVGKTDGRGSSRAAIWGKQMKREVSRGTVSEDLQRKDSSLLSVETESDSDSDSSTDSEREREREERRRRREKIFAEKVAAKAVGAIKERENVVARLEGEKQSLEKILEERAKQQAQEASELQTTTMETMEAVELEKQKHNNTRMEVLARLARLETANADLARSLAAGQKKLETQIDQVAELREHVELKESALEELKRKISNIHQSGQYLNEIAAASGGSRFEHEMLEAECSLLTDKIGRLQDKADKLGDDIEMMRKEIEEPTEVEIELNRRLNQLTDHLIQKQSQVEALSSEKATLFFRIEAVSKLLEENNAMSTSEASSKDLEAGEWKFSESKLRPSLQEKIRSGKEHLGWMVRQMNAIFVSGAVFLRRNPTAKIWAAVYVICLHLWVLYILFSHSNESSSEGKSGAVISLENFAK